MIINSCLSSILMVRFEIAGKKHNKIEQKKSNKFPASYHGNATQ